jgi:hypothetical protein
VYCVQLGSVPGSQGEGTVVDDAMLVLTLELGAAGEDIVVGADEPATPTQTA